MTPVERRAGRAPAAVVKELRAAFAAGRSRGYATRLAQLDGLARFCNECEREIEAALHEDLGKPALEAFTAEIAFIKKEIAFVKKRLRAWMKPERASASLLVQPARGSVYREPLGVVLIIAPWNYPFQLGVSPLLGAIAAGNCAILKPSELAPATSALLATRLPQYLDGALVQVVEGGVAETGALLKEEFDHIFYTGNGNVAKIILQAAAEHLTPVTLELGGKSPCIVDADADLEVTARRIAWGKFFNAGQTCVAPDYILAHKQIEEPLVAALKRALRDFYGEDPRTSADYGRIVNSRHHRRLVGLLAGSGEVAAGGQAVEAERYLAPTILTNVAADAPVMHDEIFGPILPVLRVDSLDEAIAFVNARPKPLALYLFSRNGEAQERVLTHTSSGGVLVNHTVLHVGELSLPFGGVGASGTGAYHGRASFETFSHRKAVLKKATMLDPNLLYPPYDDSKKKWIRRIVG